MRILLCIAACLMLAGCPDFKPLHKPTTETLTPAQQAERTARHAYDEARTLLTTLYMEISANRKAGIWTREEGDSYLAEADHQDEQLKKAKVLLDNLDFSSAKIEADLVKTLLTNLRKRVAANARSAQ